MVTASAVAASSSLPHKGCSSCVAMGTTRTRTALQAPESVPANAAAPVAVRATAEPGMVRSTKTTARNAGDPRVQRFNDEPLRDVTSAATLIEFRRAESASDARRHWAVTADDEVIGLIGLHTWEHHHRRAELGYDMAVSRWGQGTAGEAARAVIDYGFTTMRLHRIEAHTIADNHPSVRLLERLGFQREGTLRELLRPLEYRPLRGRGDA